MGTVTKINNKKGISFRAQVRKFHKGKIIYSEAKTFTKESDARRWIARREEQIDSPEAVARITSNTITVGDLIDRYLNGIVRFWTRKIRLSGLLCP